jgi:hypothetical protein
MFDRVAILDIIDRAFDEQPFCVACGSPSALRNDGDRVILECSASGGSGILTRIGDFFIPHTRRVVIDMAEGFAA